MPKFTERQYDVVPAPKAVHDKLLARYREMLPKVTQHSSLEFIAYQKQKRLCLQRDVGDR